MEATSPSQDFLGFFLLILSLCSIYSNGGHVGWSAGSSDITFKADPLRMIQAKFRLNWPSGFRGEDLFIKVYGRTTDGRTDDGRTDDGRQVMAKAHMAF